MLPGRDVVRGVAEAMGAAVGGASAGAGGRDPLGVPRPDALLAERARVAAAIPVSPLMSETGPNGPVVVAAGECPRAA